MRETELERSIQETENEHISDMETMKPKILQEYQKVMVWRFPLCISQSSICGKAQLSNACTLIALKIAELIHIHNVEMPRCFMNTHNRAPGGSEMDQRKVLCEIGSVKNNLGVNNQHQDTKVVELNCPDDVLACLINGIVDGNETYSKDAGIDTSRVYNLPDAIKACKYNFKEIDFKLCTTSIDDSLPKMITAAVRWYSCPAFSNEKRLFFVMIGCIRTILIVYERSQNTLTLFDSHMHLWHDSDMNKNIRHGAVIATCSFEHVSIFAIWVRNCIFPDISKTEFEISFVQLEQSEDHITQTVCNTHVLPTSSKRMVVFSSSGPHINENIPIIVNDYPVLREMLSKPPRISYRNATKRQRESRNGVERFYFGDERMRKKVVPITSHIRPHHEYYHENNNYDYTIL